VLYQVEQDGQGLLVADLVAMSIGYLEVGRDAAVAMPSVIELPSAFSSPLTNQL